MSLPKRLRYEVLRRDNYTCRYCGSKPPNVVLHVDHVVPVSLGGTDDPSNLTASCQDCNLGKSSVGAEAPLVAEVNAEAEKWGRAVRQAADERSRKPFDMEVALVAEVFDGWYVLTPRNAEAIRQKLLAGLPVSEVAEAAWIAREAKHVEMGGVFPYFMGVCRNKLNAIYERAEQLLSSEAEEGPHALDCSHCGRVVEPFDDEPDEKSVTWQSAYRCDCGAYWTAPWEMDGSEVDGYDYSASGLGSGI